MEFWNLINTDADPNLLTDNQYEYEADMLIELAKHLLPANKADVVHTLVLDAIDDRHLVFCTNCRKKHVQLVK